MIDASVIIDYTHEDFLQGIDVLAKQISEDKFNPDYIVGIVRGGSVPAVYLSHKLSKPVQMVHWSSRDSSLLGNESNCWIPDDINCGKRVLLVDDIVDGGDTIRQILEDWQESVRQDLVLQNIRVASLFYNTTQDVKVDFYHRTIDRNLDQRWVIFPWER